MGTLFWQMMVTADGFAEGPTGDLDWHVVDADFERYVAAMLDAIDGILLGRVTYEGFAEYWPTATDPEAAMMNRLPKYVFSRTLAGAGWENTRLISTDAATEIRRLKEEASKPLALFGSPTFASAVLSMGLIDELRIFVNPVVLGAGRPMVRGERERFPLRLERSEPFASGLVCLYYRLG